MYTITKKQELVDNYKIYSYYFDSARESFEYILTHNLKCKTILLPAYIGYSINEGSGIFDPVKNANSKYKFYNLDINMNINLNSIYSLIDTNPNSILLLVHYYGFIDQNIDEIKQYAKKNQVTLIEDCAHAYFTFFNNFNMDSDYYIFSLHKMFPYANGGLLISKKELSLNLNTKYNLFEYNLYEISQKRILNYNYLKDKLNNISDIGILHNVLNNNIPQTFPLLITSERLRDKLYFTLNDKGFGAVSLYHQLINEIDLIHYENEFFLSSHILNLPIHQDVTFSSIDEMANLINKIIREYNEEK